MRTNLSRRMAISAIAALLFGTSMLAQESAPSGVGPPSPTLPEALKILAASRAAATRMRLAISCAVADSTGQPIAVERMDDARFFTVDAARTLAMNSALSGGSSENASAQNIKNLPKQARIYAAKGGLPLMRSGKVVGAVACNGSTPDQDADGARAGQGAF